MTFRIATDKYTGVPEIDLAAETAEFAPHDDDPPMGDEATFTDGSRLYEGMRGDHEVNRGAW